MKRDPAAFISALLAALRTRAAEEEPDDRPVLLAAHLLAACEVLDVRQRDLVTSAPRDPVATLLAPGAALPAEALLACLLALDACVGRGPVGHQEVGLTRVEAGGLALAGTVTCAPRGPRPLRDRRDAGDHPIAWDRPPHLLRHVQLWWNRPDIPVDVRLLPGAAEDGRPWALRASGPLRVLLAPLFGVPLPHLRVARRGPRWTFRATAGAGPIPMEVRARIAEVVAGRSVDLLVMPELLGAPEDVAWAAAISSRASIPGSWHVERGGVVRNEAPLLDRRGLRGVHAKRGQFALRAGAVAKLVARGAVTVDDGPVPEGCHVEEGFEPGTELLVFDTPVGRATLVVCADLLDVGDCLFRLVAGLAPDLLVVVAMSETTRDFVQKMDELAHLGTATLLVNAAEAAAPGALVAACRLPWKGHPHLPHRVEMTKDGEAPRTDGALFEWIEGVGLLVDFGAVAARAS